MPTNRFDFSQYQPDWGDDSSSDLEELALPEDLVARIEKEQGSPLTPEQRKALGQQITDDMLTTGMTFDTDVGKRGPVPADSKFNFGSYDPQGGDEWTPAPQTKPAVVLPQKAEPTDTTFGQDLERIGAEVTDAFSNFFPKADVQSRLQSAQDIIKAGANGGYYQYAGPDDTKGTFVPVSQEDVEHAKRTFLTTAAEGAAINKKSEEFLGGYPTSNEQKAYQQGRSKDTSLAGTLENMSAHKGAVASSMLTGVIEFSPTILAGAVDPVLGAVTGATQMAGGVYGDASAQFLATKGIDPSDSKAVEAFYSDPKNVETAMNYVNMHTAVMAGVAAALPGVGKATNAVLPVTKSVAAEVALKTAANTATAGGTFVAGTAAANALTGQETTGQEVVDSATAGLPFVLKDMAGFHEGAVKERVRRGIDAQFAAQDAAGHTNTALNNKGSIEEALNLKNRMERAQAAGDRNTKLDQYEQEQARQNAETQETADQREADERNNALEREYAGKTRLDKYADGRMERVPLNPPQEWTAEKVRQEREQATEAEAARVDRVEVGKLTEFLRKRQELAARKASDANSATEKAARTAEGKRRREVADQLTAENPGVDPADLVPELRKRLAKPVEGEKAPVEPVQAETPEKPAEEATALTDQESEDLARDSGMYIPKAKEQANKAGIDTGPDSLDSVPSEEAKGGKPTGFWGRLDSTIKALHERGLKDKTARAGVDVARQGKLVIVPSAKSVNHTNQGQASYQFKDGKMYVYMDKVAEGNEVSTLLKAASHESVHRLKRTPSNSRGATIASLLTPELHEKVSNAILAGHKAGNKLAVNAVARGLRGAEHARAQAEKRGAPLSDAEVQKIAEEETVAYFVEEAVAAKQARQGYGRMGGAVKDILHGTKVGVADALGIDFQPTIEDLAHVSQDVLGEVAKDTTGPKLQSGSADMIAGETGKEFGNAGFIYKGAKDGKLRYEFSDEKAKWHPDSSPGMTALRTGKTVKLGDILDHPELYKNYPNAKEIEVIPAEGMGRVPGSFNPNDKAIKLNRDILTSGDSTLSTLLHEVQHWIQDREGFIGGANYASFISKVATRERDNAQKKFEDFMNGFKLQKAIESLPPDVRRTWDAQVEQWNKEGGLTMEGLATKFLDSNYGSNSTNRFVQQDNSRYYSLRTDVKTTADKYAAEEKKAMALYLRDHGEAEARNTQYRRLFNDEQRKTQPPESTMKDAYGNVDVADTLDTSKLRPGQSISNSESMDSLPDSLDSFREKGEGEIHPMAYEDWHASLAGARDFGDLAESVHEADMQSDGGYVRAMADWAGKASKRYLDRYAGTPDDPLKDVVLPNGDRWEDMMDEAVVNVGPVFATDKEIESGKIKDRFMPTGKDQMPGTDKGSDYASQSIRSFLDHVNDYMWGVDPADWSKYDLVRAVKETIRSDEAAAKRAAKAKAKSDSQLAPVRDYEDGTRWVQLTKPGQFAQESDVMGHSVRGYEPPASSSTGERDNVDPNKDAPPIAAHPDWIPESGDQGHAHYGHGGWESIKKGTAKIFSLRDKNGVSHVTIETGTTDSVRPMNWFVEDLPSDSPVRKEIQKYVDARGYKTANRAHKTRLLIEAIEAQPEFQDAQDASVPQPFISQIKGKSNAKPIDKYIPFVQDFVRNQGPWRDVKDLRNADMWDIGENHHSGMQYVTGDELIAASHKLTAEDKKNYENGYGLPQDAKVEQLPIHGLPEVKKAPSSTDSMDSLDSEEPLKDRKDKPRLAGETEAQWDERIAKENVNPLKKAFNSLFGIDTQREHGRQIIVGTLAQRDRQYTTAERELSKFKTYFDKLTEEQRLKLNDDWENGREITDPTAKAMFEAINPLFKDAIDYIKQKDPAILKKLREFYLPHVWKKPAKASAFFQSKGPLAGPKSFAKTRRWPTMKEAMESGLEPVTTNPAELAMLKYGELLKYAGLLRMKEDLAKKGWLVKAEERGIAPLGYAAVRDPSFNNTYVPEPIARDLNNYLSRGLTDVPGFKQIRYLENLMVAGKLGWSGFHAGFTTMDNFVTHLEESGRRMLDGDVKGGLANMLKAPLSIAMSPYQGGDLLKEFTGRRVGPKMFNGVDEHTSALLDLLEKGGARAFMDASEWNAGLPKILQAVRQRKPGMAAKYVLPAIADASGWLIHRKLVPAQKMSARTLLLKYELDRFAEKLGKERGDYTGIIEAMHPDAAAQISRKVVNLVDDRLGHMAYDNQFWNAYAKHMAQLVVMAPGWVSGTFKTIGGGVGDARRLISPEKIIGPLDKAGKVGDAKFGRITSRTANLITLSMLTAAASGAFMYMMTGQWPESPKDYVHPKTGRKNSDGTDERISWPTYAKEHYALVTDPVKEVTGKLNQPLISTAWDLLENADYTNTEVYDSKAPVGTQAKEIAKYIAEGFYKPISATNLSKADKMDVINPDDTVKNRALRAGAMFGMTPASAEIDQSEAEHFINEKYFDSFPKETLSRADKERFAAKAEAAAEIKRGGNPDLSAYSDKEKKAINKNAGMETYTKRFAGIRSIEDRLEAWDLATPEEREKYGMKAILLKNARTQVAAISNPETKAEVQKRINEIRNQ